MQTITINNMQKLTIGEQKVRLNINPCCYENDYISKFKKLTAELINLCEEIKSYDKSVALIAQIKYEEACLFAIKLVETNDYNETINKIQDLIT